MTMLGLAALLGLCFRHCYFLENMVRRWLSDRRGDAGDIKERLVNTYTAKRRWSLCEKVLVLMTKR